MALTGVVMPAPTGKSALLPPVEPSLDSEERDVRKGENNTAKSLRTRKHLLLLEKCHHVDRGSGSQGRLLFRKLDCRGVDLGYRS